MTPPDYTPAMARELRAAAGLTQSEMAQAVGYTAAQNWSAIERGLRAPSRSTWLMALVVGGQHPQYTHRITAD